jgi:hypothetical protein
MNTKHSGISSWFAGSAPSEKRNVAGQPVDFLTRLGDVKVETKGVDGQEAIDNVHTMDRYT